MMRPLSSRPERCARAARRCLGGAAPAFTAAWSCAALLLPALVAASFVDCGGSQHTGPEPEVALANSAEAQARFRTLRQRWVSSPLDTRVALERSLTDFIQRYPTDPQGRWVRIYLAWISVQRGRLDDAARWLALAEPGPAGAASDLAGVVRAALNLSKGQAAEAYRDLLALSGRLIDADDRLLCLDQLVLAALADHRYRDAVLHMLELSAQAARRHRERMWRTLEPRLASIPLPELEASLPNLSSDKIQNPSVAPAERAAAVDWMRRTLLDLLSRSAIDEQDVALAQRLVASAQGPRGDEAEKAELLLLATRGTLQKTVSGRTLGLALELGDAAQSQRSIDVASGIALTLDLAAPARDPNPIVLTTRQVEDGNVSDALARLSGDGASLIVAGLDAIGARAAADFAASSGVPVLLLHEPAGSETALSSNIYVLGVWDARANDTLFATLDQRFRGVVRIGEGAAPCPNGDAELDALLARASAGGRRPRLQFDSDPSCARGVLMRLSDSARPLSIGFGLSALGVAWDDPEADEVWAVGAGRLPRLSGSHDALASRWFSSKGRPPTWYEALGHDAALIASRALGPAPSDVERDPERLRVIYRAVEQRLASERWSDLWTSDGERFDASRRLAREFRAERIAPKPTGGGR
jgi:hypothetical protein